MCVIWRRTNLFPLRIQRHETHRWSSCKQRDNGEWVQIYLMIQWDECVYLNMNRRPDGVHCTHQTQWNWICCGHFYIESTSNFSLLLSSISFNSINRFSVKHGIRTFREMLNVKWDLFDKHASRTRNRWNRLPLAAAVHRSNAYIYVLIQIIIFGGRWLLVTVRLRYWIYSLEQLA